MVAKLPAHFDPPAPGPMESVDEIPSVTDYFDGSKNLNVIKVQCKIYANASDCLKQSSCGWCGSTNGCILGNNLGPLQSCVKSSYIFSAPYPNWNPQTRVVNDQIGGVGLTVVSK
jgi:hypothetical protein